jgi:hypothetical protein
MFCEFHFQRKHSKDPIIGRYLLLLLLGIPLPFLLLLRIFDGLD